MTELDDLFHWCAFVAFVEVTNAVVGWPDSESVKRRAYAMYEAELSTTPKGQVNAD